MKAQRSPNKFGFSLLEVLVAIMILSAAILTLSSSWSGSLASYRKSKQLTTVSYLLKKKMAELEVLYSGTKVSSIPEEDGGDFGSEYPNFKWKLASKGLDFPDLSPVLISESGQSEMVITLVKQMTEQISNAVREVKLSVLVKAGPRTLEHSVTTYFVDFSKEIGLPGGAGGGSTTAGSTAGGG